MKGFREEEESEEEEKEKEKQMPLSKEIINHVIGEKYAIPVAWPRRFDCHALLQMTRMKYESLSKDKTNQTRP